MAFPIRANRLVSRSATAAAFAAASLVSLGHQPALAVTVQVNGADYDLTIYSGSYNNQPGYFQTPANGGRMPWWGQPSLASDFAFALAAGLSPTPLPANGPLFATAYNGSVVEASYYDLSTLGSTDVINENMPFAPGSVQSYAVLSNPAPVPAPLPLFGAAAGFSAARRLRRRLVSRRQLAS
jgi:hypothetical protein